MYMEAAAYVEHRTIPGHAAQLCKVGQGDCRDGCKARKEVTGHASRFTEHLTSR
jgi:hypothetical protein